MISTYLLPSNEVTGNSAGRSDDDISQALLYALLLLSILLCTLCVAGRVDRKFCLCRLRWPSPVSILWGGFCRNIFAVMLGSSTHFSSNALWRVLSGGLPNDALR